ncbi:type-F conjugative transfer system secretin TraK [Scandinavium sp. NPDC088450]|uniref:type-F conjugative transfer system secretin TraK n=1 Tax=Scandinavium sp. NPDC088450 TaxID=3364514 RepID=UPI0038500756
MKLRISPAAAAVFVAFGFFTSGLRAATGPAGIPFENDASFSAVLSNTNPNKIVIDGELITRISGPSGAYDGNTTVTEDGALIFSPLTSQNFTVFLETEKGASLSLNVQPRPVTGRTLRFTPVSPPARKNDDARAWEEGQSYEKTLVAISRAVSQGDVPDDFTEYSVSRMAPYTPDVGLSLTAERQLVGSHFRVVRFRLRNPGYVTRTLRERDFWKKGVRGVMLSTRQLYVGGEGFVWVIFSDEGVNNQ